ncbi:16S rRNA (guanine1207-N2)-methyltransferase [Pelagirhabdus alkalitolerans]|uniref:16S rRNA (Guanine1207-N2)-methyltransferase n=1 Tax=Pelagirhabdus alkalitolerans TaxID=1612202 RepID=A0A1G6MBP0_9BACI|nr:class I SAM-dependent methyltransferase [Pelagirhabdus alkalitolerans]SDC52355.1 16S rRNA (guanine1207-N2)-methyltransferase [Pelagirhabdus alkalitolerans]
MSEQYFTGKPQIESHPETWSYALRGVNMTFTSDRGVFSKGGVDFGSRLLIETFSAPDLEGAFVDLGCGYGPIGLALAKVYPNRQVVMADVNHRAIDLAIKNKEANRIENVEICVSDGFSNITTNAISAVLTNPPIRAGKQVVHQLLEESYEKLLPEGELWVVIQKKQGASSAVKKLETLFSEVSVVKKDKGYHIIRAVKTS